MEPHHDRKARIVSSNVFGVSFDAHDAQAVASFWAAALGRTVAEGAGGDNAAVNADPAVPGSRISFHRVPESKTVKNRVHFDLITTDFDAEIDRLTGLGATKLNEIKNGNHWATLADPEGNEFDVIDG
jgi:predicted enzyme related to lactoylglutathione lyase